MEDFITAWKHFHPQCAPVSHELKYADPDRWLRFHYQGGSRRSVKRVNRGAATLGHLNIIAGEVLGSGSACWMSGPLYPPDDLSHDVSLAILRHWNLPKVWHLEPPDYDCRLDIHAVLTTWEANRFDDILRLIENDEIRVMWMSVETGTVFAPYDRGVDLILPTVADVRRLAYEHSDWLSSYPGGL